MRPPLYLIGVPGSVGGAATKVAHLIKLLHKDFAITLVPPEPSLCKLASVRRRIEPFEVPCIMLKDIPSNTGAVCLAVCDRQFFVKKRPLELKKRGLKVIWSNEMMWAFEGEEESARCGLVDRVLFVSEFQAQTFGRIYSGVPSRITGNYVDPDEYCWTERKNITFTLGRLSRPDIDKYPADFPVFYESIGLRDVRYRVMAWSQELQKRYSWHNFGPAWELIPADKEDALRFLYTIDVFLYPIGHRVKESWGRAVVEAMLTGCVPVVPDGHQFHKFIAHSQTGFICSRFCDYRDCVRELCRNYALRRTVGLNASEFARLEICDPHKHREVWREALTLC